MGERIDEDSHTQTGHTNLISGRLRGPQTSLHHGELCLSSPLLLGVLRTAKIHTVRASPLKPSAMA